MTEHFPRIYLAGPEVFFPEAVRASIDRRKKKILRTVGLEGVSPFDNTLELTDARNPAQEIYDANRELMEQAAGLMANLTPFRGPSADAGTIYELGYMIGRGKPAVGFSVCSTFYNERVSRDSAVCANGADIEMFGLADNLMLDCGLARAGGKFFTGETAYPPGGFPPEAYFEEAVFVAASRYLAQLIRERQSGLSGDL